MDSAEVSIYHTILNSFSRTVSWNTVVETLINVKSSKKKIYKFTQIFVDSWNLVTMISSYFFCCPALSYSLWLHFIPLSLSTLGSKSKEVEKLCSDYGFFHLEFQTSRTSSKNFPSSTLHICKIFWKQMLAIQTIMCGLWLQSNANHFS